MYSNTHVLISLVCSSILFNALCASSADPKPLILSCGLKVGGTDSDGRKWESDSSYITGDSNMARAQTQDPSLLSEVPYMTARIMKSESTYKFSVKSDSRYWIRFHFYPSAYENLDINKAYFSVVAGGVTLLNNFSAAITAEALTQAYMVREYSLAPLNSDFLNVTFKPSDKYEGAFAFVNGIELIPIPELFSSASTVGYASKFVDFSSANLQTLYRLNVGGNYIPATNDSAGLTRTWYDDMPYIYGASEGITTQADAKVTIQHPDKVKKDALGPDDVYRTQRSSGLNELSTNFNLTWVFQVDASFMYLVRFHLCDYTSSKTNQIIFSIYINNQTADSGVDVFALTRNKATATYLDYAVLVADAQGDDEIRVQMHPSVDSKPEFYDTLLNGLEIFKVQDSRGNLAGPNPVKSALLLKAEAAETEEEKKFEDTSDSNAHVIGGAAGGAVVVAAVLCVAAYQRKKRVLGSDSSTTSWLPIFGNSHTKSTSTGKSTASSNLSTIAQGLCRHFSLAEIKQGTSNFSESNVIGVGGFGKVYRGVIDGETTVAIKRSNPSSEQGVHEFETEIEMLSKLRHKHLVSLIGFCDEDNEMCLVYDYMGNGTLREHIFKNNKNVQLSWKQRLEICIGAARGLHYLHTGAKYTIIHRDVKTTNILLDDKWVAKVSDFGLSKTGPDLNQGHVSTVVKGSFGYLDPEYFRRQQLTEKSDVYSFGVVLFEVLCARPALNPTLPKEQVSLADWALHCQRKGTLDDIIDPMVKEEITPECLKKFADTAEKCLSDHGIERPSMGDVLWNLEFALSLQNVDKRGSNSETTEEDEENVLSII